MIDAKTELYGFFAHPARHSKSPLMHNTAFAYHHMNAAYMAFDVQGEAIQEAVNSIRTLGILGVNLSMPLKETVIPYLDEMDEAAAVIGAVNTIKNTNGHLKGFNTDGLGLLNALSGIFEPKQAHMILLGAGGAAKSVAAHFALAGGAKISLFNRHIDSTSRAAQLQQMIQKHTDCQITLASLDDTAALKAALGSADILVNGTNLGMGVLEGQSAIPKADAFSKDIIVFDMIYAPLETQLLKVARQAGMTRTFNGLGMLLEQGAAAFKIWTGLEMPVDLVQEKLEIN